MNCSRFLLTVKWDATSHRKDSLKLFFFIAFALTVMFVIDMMEHRVRPALADAAETLNGEYAGTALFFFCIMGMMYGLYAFGLMKPGRQRTAFLMLPASVAEKFAARCLWVSVGYALTFAAALVVADALQMLIGLTLDPGPTGSAVVGLAERCSSSFSEFVGYYAGLQGKGLYLTLACVWFLLMFLVLHVCLIAVGLLPGRWNKAVATLAVTAAVILFDLFSVPYTIYGAHAARPVMMLAAACVAETAAVAAVYALAYRTFSRMQIK